MKALWLVERFPPDRGGMAVAAARQVRSLAPRLARLDVLRLDDELPPARVVCESREGVSLHRVGCAPKSEESLQILIEAARHLSNAAEHDLLHGFCAVPAGYAATVTARLAGKPAIVSLRGNDVDRGLASGRRLPMLLWTIQHADVLAGVSREILRKAAALVDRGKALRFVPNGVDTDVFTSDGGQAVPIPEEAPRPWIAFSGELRLKKGLTILESLAERLARAKRGTLVLIGGVRNDERATFGRWRQAAPEAARRVREMPYDHDPARLAAVYRAMDVFVFPSLWEGLPNALLEAMACGRPVVVSNVGGLSDVVEDGVNGRIVPVERLDTFTDRVLDLLDDAETRERLARAARERMLEAFTLDHEREALLTLYRELAG
jgi:phosphatidylinositol alpha-1,6-mannosyltransferase